MTKPALPAIRFDVYKLLLLQCALVGVIGLLLLFYLNMHAALSVLLGGVVCIVPNFFFARQLLAKLHATQPKQIIKTLLLGEMVKLASIAILFVLVILYLPVNMLPVLIGFITAQLSFWLAPLVLNVKQAGFTTT